MIDLNDAGLPSPFDNRRFTPRPPIHETPLEQLLLLPLSLSIPASPIVEVSLRRVGRVKRHYSGERTK